MILALPLGISIITNLFASITSLCSWFIWRDSAILRFYIETFNQKGKSSAEKKSWEMHFITCVTAFPSVKPKPIVICCNWKIENHFKQQKLYVCMQLISFYSRGFEVVKIHRQWEEKEKLAQVWCRRNTMMVLDLFSVKIDPLMYFRVLRVIKNLHCGDCGIVKWWLSWRQGKKE